MVLLMYGRVEEAEAEAFGERTERKGGVTKLVKAVELQSGSLLASKG